MSAQNRFSSYMGAHMCLSVGLCAYVCVCVFHRISLISTCMDDHKRRLHSFIRHTYALKIAITHSQSTWWLKYLIEHLLHATTCMMFIHKHNLSDTHTHMPTYPPYVLIASFTHLFTHLTLICILVHTALTSRAHNKICIKVTHAMHNSVSAIIRLKNKSVIVTLNITDFKTQTSNAMNGHTRHQASNIIPILRDTS